MERCLARAAVLTLLVAVAEGLYSTTAPPHRTSSSFPANDSLLRKGSDATHQFEFIPDGAPHYHGLKKTYLWSIFGSNSVGKNFQKEDSISFSQDTLREFLSKFLLTNSDNLERDQGALLALLANDFSRNATYPTYLGVSHHGTEANPAANFNSKSDGSRDSSKLCNNGKCRQSNDSLSRIIQRRSVNAFHHDTAYASAGSTSAKFERSLQQRKFVSQGSSSRSAHLLRHSHFPSSLKGYRQLDIASSYPKAPPHWSHNTDAQMPLVWLEEPRSEVLFSNDTGAVVSCAAATAGGAPASVTWTAEDGGAFLPVPELVEVLSNGSLWFLPFAGRRYDAAVHDTSVACSVASDRGALISRPAHVTAVVSSKYEVQVYDQVVIAGNIAVLRCQVPPELASVLTVTAWLMDGSINIFPSLYGDGAHHMLPDGVLLVTPARPSEAHHTYQCRALHSLTGTSQLSPYPARVIVTESDVATPPRMHDLQTRVVTEEGNSAVLPCVAEGSPPPQTSWYKDGSPAVSSASHNSWSRVSATRRQVAGALVISAATAADAGEWRCEANSSAGVAERTVHLTVTAPLKVQLLPPMVRANVGGRTTLRCVIDGRPVLTIAWFKDGKPLRSSSRVRLLTQEELVISPVQADDAGLYQCRASSAQRVTAHAAAHLTLGASAPRLLYRFIAHTLQPGPAVSLKCIARATPTPHIAWTLDGFPLPQSHRFVMGQYVSGHGDVVSHVNISSVRVVDGGLYECAAHNTAGQEAHSARLNVYGPPTVRPMGPLTAVAGHTFRVACPVGGHPIHKITWQKDGQPLPQSHHQEVSSNGTLVLTSVSRDRSEGRYSCSAFDKQGHSDQGHFDLRVVVPPHLGPLVFPSGTRAGMRAQSSCFVQEGDLPMEIHWEKDGHRLVSAANIKVNQMDDYTSILTITNAVSKNAGNYSCVARNAGGSVSTSAVLAVNVPPSWVVEPNDVSLPLGGSVVVPCRAEGFPPPHVTWQRKTASGEWVTLEKVTESFHVNHLNQKRNFAASFSPQAYKEESLSSGTARTLQGIVPPRLEHKNAAWNMNRRGSSTFRIANDARSGTSWANNGLRDEHRSWNIGSGPWKINDANDETSGWPGQNGGHSGGDRLPSFRKVFNGSLVLTSAARNYEGLYLCRSENGVGSSLSKVVQVTIHEPPWFSERGRRLVQVEVGSSAALSCKAHGDAPLSLSWTKDGSPVPPTESRYSIQSLKDSDGSQLLELTIKKATASDSGEFVCLASNPHGTSDSQFTVVVEDVPGAPTGVRVRESDSRHVSLTWSAPLEQSVLSAPVESYVIVYERLAPEEPVAGEALVNSDAKLDVDSAKAVIRKTDTKPMAHDFSSEVKVASGLRNHRVEGLWPASWYTFIVAAENRVGRGPYSAPLRHRTEEEKPSSPPRNVMVSSPSSRSLRVSWQPPPHNRTHGRLLGYYLGIRRRSAQDDAAGHHNIGAYNFTTVGGGDASSSQTHTVVTDLRPHSFYDIVVRAFNSRGAGPSSDPVLGQTLQDRPSAAPEPLRCEAESSTVLSLRWSPPPAAATNGVLTHYVLKYSLSDDAELATSSVLPRHGSLDPTQYTLSTAPDDALHYERSVNVHQGTATRIEGLAPWTNYSVRVAAATEAGAGVSSQPVVCTTKEDVPLAIEVVKAFATGPHSVIVSWGSPPATRGILKHYTVYWHSSTSLASQANYKKVEPTHHHLKIKDLPQETIKVWVTASTSIGSSPASERKSVAPSRTVGAGIWSVGGQVVVRWKEDVSLPCRTVGVPEPQRTWTRGGTKLTQNSSGLQLVTDGSLRLLRPGRNHSGSYSCSAVNSFGSDSITYVVSVLVPPSAPVLHVTETTPSFVRLQWDVPDDGGSSITLLSLSYSKKGDVVETVMVRGESHTVYGLDCGTEYVFHIVARNAIGTSEASEVVSARTKGRPPVAPPLFQFVTTNSSQATLYLTQWDSGGCPITHYLVQYRDASHAHWTTVSSEVLPSRTFAVTGLAGGTAYEIRVTAHNSAGATKALYSVTTPSDSAGDAGFEWNSLEGSRSSTLRPSAWKDLRIILPVCLSFIVIIVSGVKVLLCIKKQKQRALSKKETYCASGDHCLYEAGKPTVADSSASPDYMEITSKREGSGESDTYQYASNSQFGPITAEASVAPSPSRMASRGAYDNAMTSFSDEKIHKRRSYATLVYQTPSLKNVDAANQVGSRECETLLCGEAYQSVKASLSQQQETSKREDHGLNITAFHPPNSSSFMHPPQQEPPNSDTSYSAMQGHHSSKCASNESEMVAHLTSSRRHHSRPRQNLEFVHSNDTKVHAKVRTLSERNRYI